MSGWSPAVPRSKAPAANPATASPTCMVCWPPSSVGTVPRADPADVAVTGQAVGRVAPVPDLPGDVAAEDLVPAGLQPFPAQPQPGHQPDPAGGARSEQPSRESRLFDVHRCARRTPIGGASHGATRLLPRTAPCRSLGTGSKPAGPGHGPNGRCRTGPSPLGAGAGSGQP